MHNGTRDQVQTYLTVVGGVPTKLSHERTPWGVSTEQHGTWPGASGFGFWFVELHRACGGS